jgi:hypothetical protein
MPGERVTPTGGDAAPCWALVLERDSPKPDAEIGRLLAFHLGLHPTDAILRVRYGGGLLVEGVSEETAEELGRRLAGIGVRTRRVDEGSWGIEARGYRAFGLTFADDSLEVRLVTGRRLRVPRADVHAVHLYCLAAPPGEREEHEALRREPVLQDVLSLRGRQLLRKLEERGLRGAELHLTLLCAEPVGPVRVRRNDFDFTCLGPGLEQHSLDNFLLLLDEVLRFLPAAWNREAAAAFLEDLDPQRLLYFKVEEALARERWLSYWIRAAEEERAVRGAAAGSPGDPPAGAEGRSA